ncbi:MAG: sigma-70 family RNA polymerase sigma factor [Tissierellales bacterium]|nr:sigma-70 family RNA polymerase sigma factor [Tissierellales bacterium]MBN2826366.1 sigma-70 family RNA polymerase sigma factor [Tissierellales bacterium]
MIAFLMVIENEETRCKLEEIYRLYRGKLILIAMEILHDDYEAEDVVQNAIIKMAECIDEDCNPKSNDVQGLVIVIVRRLSINIYNKRKKWEMVDLEENEAAISHDESTDPELQLLHIDQKEWVSRELEKIKGEYADILTLRHYYDYTFKKISSILSISEDNARMRYMRAKKALSGIIGGGINGK